MLALAASCTAGGQYPTPSQGLNALTLPDPGPALRLHHSSVSTLGTYNIDPNHVYVAGFSSGGFMAAQMHVAFSNTFKGAAIYAGAVYWCVEDGGFVVYRQLCLYTLWHPHISHLADSERYLDKQSKKRSIDSERNLRGQPVYLWSGTKDTLVAQAEMNDVEAEYQHYGAKVTYDNWSAAQHGWESPDGEHSCQGWGLPWTIKCNQGSQVYDSEKTWLTMFLGTLMARNNGSLNGTLINFDQTEFGASYSNSMDTNGYVYVPQACAQGDQCSLVLVLHGCDMVQAKIGTKFITEGGVLPWADSNKVIVLYPFLVENASINPVACWDVWGYLGSNYALRSATQMSIVHSMVQRVMGRR